MHDDEPAFGDEPKLFSHCPQVVCEPIRREAATSSSTVIALILILSVYDIRLALSAVSLQRLISYS